MSGLGRLSWTFRDVLPRIETCLRSHPCRQAAEGVPLVATNLARNGDHSQRHVHDPLRDAVRPYQAKPATAGSGGPPGPACRALSESARPLRATGLLRTCS